MKLNVYKIAAINAVLNLIAISIEGPILMATTSFLTFALLREALCQRDKQMITRNQHTILLRICTFNCIANMVVLTCVSYFVPQIILAILINIVFLVDADSNYFKFR